MDAITRIIEALTGRVAVRAYLIVCDCTMMSGPRRIAEATRDAIERHGAECTVCHSDIRVLAMYDPVRVESGVHVAHMIRLDPATLEPVED